MSDGTKVCTRCGKEKVVECFSPAKGCKGGRRHICKSCLNDAKKLKRRSLFNEPWPNLRGGLRGSAAAASSRRTAKALRAIHAKDKP
jgi:hypothetical protein